MKKLFIYLASVFIPPSETPKKLCINLHAIHFGKNSYDQQRNEIPVY